MCQLGSWKPKFCLSFSCQMNLFNANVICENIYNEILFFSFTRNSNLIFCACFDFFSLLQYFSRVHITVKGRKITFHVSSWSQQKWHQDQIIAATETDISSINDLIWKRHVACNLGRRYFTHPNPDPTHY